MGTKSSIFTADFAMLLLAIQVISIVASATSTGERAFFFAMFLVMAVIPLMFVSVIVLIIIYYILSSRHPVALGGTKSSMFMVQSEVWYEYALQYASTISGIVSSTAASTYTAAKQYKTVIALLAGLIFAVWWFESNPSSFIVFVEAFKNGIVIPIWALTLNLANFVRWIVDLFVPSLNTILWYFTAPFRGILGILFHLTEGCLAEHFSLVIRSMGLFVLRAAVVLADWTGDGIWTRVPSFVPVFQEASDLILNSKLAVGCSCQALNFAAFMVPIPFGRVGLASMLQVVPQFYAQPVQVSVRLTVGGLVGSQWVTPAIVTAMANATAIPFAAIHVIAKAIYDREPPNFDPLIDAGVDASVDGAKALDQSIQASLDVLNFIASSPENNLNFDYTAIVHNGTRIWPPYNELVAMYGTWYIRVGQQVLRIALNVTNYGQFETWNMDQLFGHVMEFVGVAADAVRIVLRDSQIPFLAGPRVICVPNGAPSYVLTNAQTPGVTCPSGTQTVRTGGLADASAAVALAALNILRFVKDVLVVSIIGGIDSATGASIFGTGSVSNLAAIMKFLKKDYDVRVVGSIEMAALQLGSALGYEVGPLSQLPLGGRSDALGCVAQEGLMAVAGALIALESFFTTLFASTSYVGMAAKLTNDFLPLFSRMYGLSRCASLAFEGLYSPIGNDMCSVRFNGNIPQAALNTGLFSKPRELTMFPLASRQDMCTSSTSPCMRMAAPPLVQEFEALCGPLSTISFSKTLTNRPGYQPPSPPPSNTWDTTPRCQLLASELQDIFQLTCYRVLFAPDMFGCDAGYLAESVGKIVTDAAYAGLSILFQTLENLFDSNSPLYLTFPREQVNLIQCDLQRLIGNVAAYNLASMTDLINTIVAIFVQNRSASSLLIQAEVETLIGNIFFSVGNIFIAPVNITAGMAEEFVTAWNTAVSQGAPPPTLASLGAAFSNIEDLQGAIYMRVVKRGVIAIAEVIIGVIEVFMELFEAASDNPFLFSSCEGTPSDNPMSPVLCAFTELVNLINLLKHLIIDIIAFLYEIWRLIVGIIGLVIGDASAQTFDNLIGDAISKLGALFGNFWASLDSFFKNLLTYGGGGQNPKSGVLGFVNQLMTSACAVINAVFSFVFDIQQALYKVCSWHLDLSPFYDGHPLDWIEHPCAPQQQQSITCLQLTATTLVAPAIVPQSCYKSSTCSAQATCEMPDGTLNFCSACTTFAGATAAECNTETFECVCGPLPNERTACPSTHFATDCAGPNAACVVVSQFSGMSLGTVACSTCQGNGTYTGCATVQGDLPNTPVCQCSTSPTSFVESPADFASECDSLSIGSVCDPVSSGYALALSFSAAAALPNITMIGNSVVLGTEDVQLVVAATGCNTAIPGLGRCLDTSGLLYHKSCVCQPLHPISVTNPPPPLQTRKKRKNKKKMKLESTVPRTRRKDPLPSSVQQGLRDSSSCDTNTTCSGPYALCFDTHFGGFMLCRQCPPSYLACDDSTCICNTTLGLPAARPMSLEEAMTPEIEQEWASVSAPGWYGKNKCSNFMKYVTVRSTFAQTIEPYSILEKAEIEECYRLRMIAIQIERGSRIPVPIDTFLSTWNEIDFAWKVATAGMHSLQAILRPGDAAIQDMIQHAVERGDNPGLSIRMYLLWRSLGTFLTRYVNWNDIIAKLTNGANPVTVSLVTNGVAAIQSFARLLLQTGGAYDNIASFSQNITDGLTATRAQRKMDEEAEKLRKNTAERKEDKQRQQQERHEKAKSNTEKKASMAHLSTAMNIAEQNVRKSVSTARKLLSFGSWVSAEVADCAVLLTIKETVLTAVHILAVGYGTNFVKSTQSFDHFVVHQTNLIDPVTGTQTFLDWICWPEITYIWDYIVNWKIVWADVWKRVLDFNMCDAQKITLCEVDRGLFRSFKFALFIVVCLTFAIRSLPGWAAYLVIWPMLGLYIAYDYSWSCIPLIPGCLADDIFALMVYFRPSSSEWEIVRMTRIWQDHSLTLDKCRAQPYRFDYITANIAFDTRTDTFNLADSWALGGWIPNYTVLQTQDDLFRACNYFTSVYNGAVGIGGLLFLFLYTAPIQYIVMWMITGAAFVTVSANTLSSLHSSGASLQVGTDKAGSVATKVGLLSIIHRGERPQLTLTMNRW